MLQPNEIHQLLLEACTQNHDEYKRIRAMKKLKESVVDIDQMNELYEFALKEKDNTQLQICARKMLMSMMTNLHYLIEPMLNDIHEKLQNVATIGLAELIYLETILKAKPKPNMDYLPIMLEVMIKYCCAKRHLEINQLGAIMFYSAVLALKQHIVPHMEQLMTGLEKSFQLAANELRRNPKAYHVYFVNMLVSARLMSKYVLKHNIGFMPYRKSLADILAILEYLSTAEKSADYLESSSIYMVLVEELNLPKLEWRVTVESLIFISCSESAHKLVRLETLRIIGNCLGSSSTLFVKHKMLKNLLKGLYEMLSEEPCYDLMKPHNLLAKDLPTTLSATADLYEFVSLKVNAMEVCKRFMEVIKLPENFKPNVWQRRAVFLAIARIAKGCAEIFCQKFAKRLINLFSIGLMDCDMHVRNAAVYAWQKLKIYTLTQAFNWALQVFGLFLENLRLFKKDLNEGRQHEALHIERMFNVAGIYCELLGPDIVNFLKEFLEISIELVTISMTELRITVLALELIRKIAIAARSNFIPYFGMVLTALQPYFLNLQQKLKSHIINPLLIEILSVVLICAKDDLKQIALDCILELVNNTLAIQQTDIQLNWNDLAIVLEHSPLRRSIFKFYQTLSCIMRNDFNVEILNLLNTLLRTINPRTFSTIADIEVSYNVFYEISEEIYETTMHWECKLKNKKKFTKFQFSNNNETETAKCNINIVYPSLYDEISDAFATLCNFIEYSPKAIMKYSSNILQALAYSFRRPQAELRELSLQCANCLLEIILNEHKLSNFHFLNYYESDLIEVINDKNCMNVLCLAVKCFQYCLAIEEKYQRPSDDIHLNFLETLKEIFSKLENLEPSYFKREVFPYVVSFLPILKDACDMKRFNSFLTTYLGFFERRLKMPRFEESADDDTLRAQIYIKLLTVILFKKHDATQYERLEAIFLQGMQDPVAKVRQTSATGLSMLIELSEPQPTITYQRLLKVFNKILRREKCASVCDCICIALMNIARVHMCPVTVKKLFPDIFRLLPFKSNDKYSFVAINFFLKIYRELPNVIKPYACDVINVLEPIIRHYMRVAEEGGIIDPMLDKAIDISTKLYADTPDKIKKKKISVSTIQFLLLSRKNLMMLRNPKSSDAP